MIEPRWHVDLLDVAPDLSPALRGRLTSFAPVLSFGVGRPCSGTVLVKNDDPLVGEIVDLRSRLKWYRAPAWERAPGVHEPAAVLRAYNIVSGSKDVFGADGGVQVVSADPSWILSRRQRQPVATYTALGGSNGVFTGIDQGQIVKTLVDDENRRAQTFIRTTTTNVATGVPRTLTVPIDKAIDRQIAELANSFGGFEIEIVPIDGDPLFMGDLLLHYPGGGNDNLGVFLEHGFGQQNVIGGERTRDTAKTSSDVHVLGRSDGAATPRLDFVNQPVRDYYRTILDTTESYGDIGNVEMLGTLGTGLSIYRQGPRDLLRLELAETVGIRPFDDFNLGDRITARIREGRVDIDGSVRVWGFEITPLPTGGERLTSITIEPEASS